ncbi:lysophospholipase [Rubidibacter lacunae KORDI 51-2]|uniref:Lysophospholipase n=1 Tax=Rubidibacter lacunae KORDI 51-2 TaxID=582515 RepID=U5DIR4_9CHRO|nr:alpha/beta fold hydrolase [Rubidibacter lacunae]ERN40822.1 lysophospholipase [Rubidibacter lacunae KORDI 51-2]
MPTFTLNRPPYFLTPAQGRPNSPLFVFLPGMDGTGSLLRTQTNSLERCFDIRCLALARDDQSNWDDMSDAVLELIDAERDGDRPVYLCGESFGGCLALKVATRAPELFARLVLVNPASSFRQRPFLSWGAAGTRWMSASIFKASAVLVLPFLVALERVASDDRLALVEAMRSVPAETVRWRLSLLERFDLSESALARLKLPVLLLAGGSDRLLPSVEEAGRLANVLPDARVVVLPDSGHACLLETEVRLSDIMHAHDFLKLQTMQQPGVADWQVAS